jgi:protein ImuB
VSGSMGGGGVRTLVVHCPEWPVVATGLALTLPVAVVAAGRVVACSDPARDEEVVVGLRRRQAEARCPSLVVADHDPARDVRAFEPVVAAVESFSPRVEVTRPGTCSLATRGPSRYFGGDHALAARVEIGRAHV